MVEMFYKIFDVTQFKTKLERQQALFLYIALAVCAILATVYMFVVPDTGTQGTVTRIQDALRGAPLSIFIVVFFYSAVVIIYTAIRRGQLLIAGIGFSVGWYVLAIVPVLFLSRNMLHPVNALSLGILLVISGLVLQERGLVIATAVALITLFTNFDPNLVTSLPITVMQILAIGFFVYMYLYNAKMSRIEGSEIEISERIKISEIITQIASLTLNRTSMNEVLQNGIQLIQRGYPQFYHVQVFLLDDSGRKAQLISSTGEVGRALIQKQHSIGVGSQSIIGQATSRNTHMIGYLSDTSDLHKPNDLLPDTIVEAAYPLRVGNQVIGALNLQSKLNLDLQDSDNATYQSIANSLALAIDNVRQFEIAEARIQENQDLATQARQALKEVDRLNKRLMEQAWSDYLTSQSQQLGLNIDFETNTVEENNAWSTSLTQVLEDGNLIQATNDDQQVIAIPLKVRGQVIGAMEFELGKGGEIDPNDLSLIQEVSERFGLAAENTRLIEESQRAAQREALINEIGSRLQATNNIESTLTEAVRSLSNVLGANRVSIKLRQPD